MEMTSQPSTSGLHSTENLSELSNRSGEEVDEHESDVLTKIFTKEEEISLLKQVTEADKQSLCICKFCSMDRLKILVYRVSREKKKLYPQQWDVDKKAGQKWLEGFTKRHKNKISKFPSICKIRLSQLSTSGSSSSSTKNVSQTSNNTREEVGDHENNVPTKVFTEEEEIVLLKQIREEKQSFCICKSCSMNHLKKIAYQVACKKKKTYSKSWNKDQQAESEWMKKFEERHKDEISKFPFICKMISQALTNEGQSGFNQILTLEEERSLLADIESKKTETDCICQKCVRQKLPYLAYIQASEKKIIYPESWNKNKKAGEKWLNGFAKRHNDQIDKFPFICKMISQALTNEGQSAFNQILTLEEEQSLLADIETNKTETDCVCQKCVRQKLPYLAYIQASKKKIIYPESWDRNKKAGEKWLKGFAKRHKKQIYKFPSNCKIRLSQLSTSGLPLSSMENVSKISNNTREEVGKHKNNVPTEVFTQEEEILLLKQINEDKQLFCICRSCSMDHLKRLAYQVACERKKLYPQSWDEDQQAESEWVKKFEERHKDEISIFPFICKMTSSQSLTSEGQSPFNQIFTLEEERSILASIEENKKTCNCQKCVLQIASFLAYLHASDKKIIYPESWNRNKKAGKKWRNGYAKRHKDQISKFPSNCKITLPQLLTSESSSSSTENVSKILNNTREEVGKHKNNVPTEVFTQEEEILLLKQINEDKQLFCICRSCSMDHLKKLAYQVACKKKKPYSKSWNKDQQAESEWMKKFEERHKDEISKFPFICKMISQALTNEGQSGFNQILTLEEERSILASIEENKKTCNCQKCVLQIASFLAYLHVSDKKIIYPESWNRNKKAGKKWRNGYAKRHKDQISKFPSNCKITLPQLLTSESYSSSTENVSKILNNTREEVCKYENNVPTKVFTKEEEISLLKQIKKEKQSFCFCKSCSMDRLKRLAYQVACEKKKPYPQSWNEDQQAEPEWVKKFEERHKDEISQFPSMCKMTLSQASTSEGQFLFNENLTLEEEESLLAEMETSISQKCVLM